MKAVTPLDVYRDQVEKGLIEEDPHQFNIMEHFQQLFQQFISAHRPHKKWFARWRRPELIKGIYLWGGVGVGKTFMMDCFYQCLPTKFKMRMHFHQFMAFVQHELKIHQGEINPLEKAIKKLSASIHILCLDEFIVKDIVDAMLLERLLDALFANGVCLVTTSNIEPDKLYERGLQRHSFLPAIALLKSNLHVFHIQTQKDYRLAYFKSAGVYYTPDDTAAMQHMEKTFALLSHHQTVETQAIQVLDRSIPIIKQAGDTIWFDFNNICRVPRSQHDYLELAKHFRHVLISHLPMIPSHANDTVSLFIRMVDIFYDAHIKLVLSAEVAPAQLYTEGLYLNDFQRTVSRLIEMQSEQYMQR